jgi:hypothetical protein
MEDQAPRIANGSGAAAILGAGVGCASFGILTLAEDASEDISNMLNFYNPAGPLSGVTTVAIVIWLMAWFVLERLWAGKEVALGRVTFAAYFLLVVGLLLTFPPFIDFIKAYLVPKP